MTPFGETDSFLGGFFARDYVLLPRALSAYWASPGKLEVAKAEPDLDILRHSQTHGSGMFDALFHPLVDLVCPSNELSGRNGFPAGGLRSFGPQARPGHEVVGRLVAATERASELLRERGVEGPCYGVVNINAGCGRCQPCRDGACPDVCYEGQTYIGLGDARSGGLEPSWVMEETGRREIPGFLTELAVPIPSKQFFPLPDQAPRSLAELAIYGLADAVACTRNVVDGMAIGHDFSRYYRSDQPAILVIGAGRLGTLCCLVLSDLFPGARIHAADITSSRNAVLREVCPDVATHLIEDSGDVGASLKAIAQPQPGGKFHYIISCASHQALTGRTLSLLAETCLHRRGRIGRMDHTALPGLEAGAQALVSSQLGHVNALGPADNFPYALELIRGHRDRLVKQVHVISGELADNVEQIIEVTETSAARLKEEGRSVAVGIQLNAWSPEC